MRIRRSLLTALFALAVAQVAPAFASSHREAPGIAKDPTADNTDLYAFVSPDAPGTVTFVSNWLPLLEPSGGPNFYQFDDAAWYYIIVDNVGDARDHIVYEFKFKTEIRNPNTFLYNTGPITSLDDLDFNIRQFYDVYRYDDGRRTVLGRHLPVPPSHVGDKSTPDYGALSRAAVATLSDGSKVFAGECDDPFFVDLGATFDLLTIRSLPGNAGLGVDGVGGFNTLTIALQVPNTRLTKDGKAVGERNAIIGVYSTTDRVGGRDRDRDHNGRESLGGVDVERHDNDDDDDGDYRAGHVQVSRLGAPLVNEVVIPLKDKDYWNRSRPRGDAYFLSYVQRPELSGLLNALYGIGVPTGDRADLVAVFLTGVPGLNQPARVRPAELLRLNMAIPPASSPNRLGVLAGDLAGFPNGRRLADDVVDIELRAVAGVLVPGFNVSPNNALGDGVDVNDMPFRSEFPYVALSHNGLNHEHHRVEPAHAPLQAGSTEGLMGSVAPVGENATTEIEEGLRLAGPNPASRHDLEYTIGRPARVTLAIYDLQGRTVRSLIDRTVEPGSFRASWDGLSQDGQPAGKGVFFARLAMDGTVVNVQKLVLR
jgi:hypothetical protein